MLNIGSLVVNGLDYILIVDTNYNIVYNTRYDVNIGKKGSEPGWNDFVNKDYFEVYPYIEREKSSVARCIETGEIIVLKNQYYSDYQGRTYVTNNITFPLNRRGKLIGVVELAMDVDESSEAVKAKGNERFETFVNQVKKDAGLITFETILTKNNQMIESVDKAKFLSKLPNPTLIYGETGTGKELFAQAMINYSGVPKSRVVIQNCAAVPESLIESILFGTEKGAYTGSERRKGLFEEADGGIIFLDELNSMPYHVQANLLRVLQDGTFKPIGSNKDKKVNVKVIAAMNVDPVRAMEEKIIRKDLFYRFSSGLVTLIPLRERKEDIELFIGYYIKYFSEAYGKNISKIETGLKSKFMEYEWEGNVRELRNTIESMISTVPETEKTLCEKYLPLYMREKFSANIHREVCDDLEVVSDFVNEKNEIPYYELMEAREKAIICKALEIAEGNKSRAAVILGLPRQTLKYRIEKLGL